MPQLVPLVATQVNSRGSSEEPEVEDLIDSKEFMLQSRYTKGVASQVNFGDDRFEESSLMGNDFKDESKLKVTSECQLSDTYEAKKLKVIIKKVSIKHNSSTDVTHIEPKFNNNSLP